MINWVKYFNTWQWAHFLNNKDFSETVLKDYKPMETLTKSLKRLFTENNNKWLVNMWEDSHSPEHIKQRIKYQWRHFFTYWKTILKIQLNDSYDVKEPGHCERKKQHACAHMCTHTCTHAHTCAYIHTSTHIPVCIFLDTEFPWYPWGLIPGSPSDTNMHSL